MATNSSFCGPPGVLVILVPFREAGGSAVAMLALNCRRLGKTCRYPNGKALVCYFTIAFRALFRDAISPNDFLAHGH
jgi:hypothetical protein